jgi:hypothetical protein
LVFTAQTTGGPVNSTATFNVTGSSAISALSAPNLGFTSTAGAASQPQQETVTDASGSINLTFQNPDATITQSVSPPPGTVNNAADFQFNDGNDTTQICTPTVVLSPGSSCQDGVEFKPAAGESVGQIDTATLVINDNGQPESATLIGTVLAVAGAGTPPTSATTPDLQNATIEQDNFGLAGVSVVQYCFSAPISNIFNIGLFGLQGYNTTHFVVAAGGVQVDPNPATGGKCALVQYPNTVNVNNYTLAITSNTSGTVGAVTGTSIGLPANPLGDVVLQGVNAADTGTTFGPDLIGGSIFSGSLNQLQYIFDKPFTLTNQANFAYYTTAGTLVTCGVGCTTLAGPGNSIIVQYPTVVTSAARLAVNTGAVTNLGLPATVNPEGAFNLPLGPPPNPNLVSVSNDPTAINSFDFFFNVQQTVPAGNAPLFKVYLDNGNGIAATTLVQLTSTEFEANFPSITATNRGNVVLGTVLDSAGTAILSGLTSTIGAEPITNSQPLGLSDGAVLQSALPNSTNNTVTYCFSQPLVGFAINPAAFFSGGSSGLAAPAPVVGAGVIPGCAPANQITVYFSGVSTGNDGVRGSFIGTQGGTLGPGLINTSGTGNVAGDVVG